MTHHSKRLFFGVLVAALLITGTLNKASAHNLAEDGKISAFLHIPPNDKAQSGKISIIHVYYNDQDSRFTTEGCDCKIKISEGKQVLYSGILPAGAPQLGTISVLLPDNNFSYGVIVSGTPKTAGFFQPFKLNFDIDIGIPPPPPPGTNRGWITLPIAGVLVALGSLKYRARLRGSKDNE